MVNNHLVSVEGCKYVQLKQLAAGHNSDLYVQFQLKDVKFVQLKLKEANVLVI